MAQVQRATSNEGKQYLTTDVVKNGDDYVNLGENCSVGNNLVIGNDLTIGNDATLGQSFYMPMYLPLTVDEYVSLNKGNKGILLGSKNQDAYIDDNRNGYIAMWDNQYIFDGTNTPSNEYIYLKIRSNHYIELEAEYLRLHAKEIWVETTTGGITTESLALTTTQTFKDGSGATKTMTIINGLITKIE